MKEKLTLKKHQVYMSGDQGPFRCDNCEYYPSKNSCNNKKIIEHARKGEFGLLLNSNGLAQVDPSGCSDEFKRK